MKRNVIMGIVSWCVPAYQLLVNRIPATSSIGDPTKSDCGCPRAGRTDHKTHTSANKQLVMWANATIRTTDLGNIAFLDSAAGVVNMGWPRPLAKSRTRGNHVALVSEHVLREISFSKKRSSVSTRYTMHANMENLHPHFPNYKERDCKFQKHALQNMFLRIANSDSGDCKIRKLTFANT